MKKIAITGKQVGQRLDMVLAAKLKLSRSQIQKMIKAGEISVSGKSSSAHRLLKTGEYIEINTPAKAKVSAKVLTPLPEIPIVKETPEYIVINKPAGLLMHGTERDGRVSVVDWLLNKYPKVAKVGEDPNRPGIVHRLDKDVSGLVVLAKTQDSFDNLKKQFQNRTIKKRYRALVYGEVIPAEGEIRFRLSRSAKGYRMAARPENQEGKSAITEFSIEKRFHNYTLLSLLIKTGRTHQIRAHCAAYNHPVVGDDLYGTNKDKIANKKLKLGRVFLAATDLTFTDTKGERQEFSIDLPKGLEKFLEQLKVKK